VEQESRPLERELRLAELEQNTEKVEQLRRELEELRRIADALRAGDVTTVAAGRPGAEAELNAEEMASERGRFREFWSSTFSGGIRAAFEGGLSEYIQQQLGNAAQRALSRAADRAADALFNAIFGAASGAFGGSGGGGGGGFLSGLFQSVGGALLGGIGGLFGGGSAATTPPIMPPGSVKAQTSTLSNAFDAAFAAKSSSSLFAKTFGAPTSAAMNTNDNRGIGGLFESAGASLLRGVDTLFRNTAPARTPPFVPAGMAQTAGGIAPTVIQIVGQESSAFKAKVQQISGPQTVKILDKASSSAARSSARTQDLRQRGIVS
jgi:hypothetical protein